MLSLFSSFLVFSHIFWLFCFVLPVGSPSALAIGRLSRLQCHSVGFQYIRIPIRMPRESCSARIERRQRQRNAMALPTWWLKLLVACGDGSHPLALHCIPLHSSTLQAKMSGEGEIMFAVLLGAQSWFFVDHVYSTVGVEARCWSHIHRAARWHPT